MIPIDIWIVEDDANFRRSLARIFEREEAIEYRTFPACAELFEALNEASAPSIVLMDLGLPEMSGVDGIKKLSRLAPDTAVLVLTAFEDKEKVGESLRAGATGYLLKSSTAEEILKGVRDIFMGGSVLSPTVARLVLGEIQQPTEGGNYDLSEREVEVLEQLATGLSNKEIADHLGISRRTVAFHLEKIYTKLSVHSQAGAVAKALRSGVI